MSKKQNKLQAISKKIIYERLNKATQDIFDYSKKTTNNFTIENEKNIELLMALYNILVITNPLAIKGTQKWKNESNRLRVARYREKQKLTKTEYPAEALNKTVKLAVNEEIKEDNSIEFKTINSTEITAKSDSQDIRIYINGLLHLRFPRDKYSKIQSWIEGDSKLFKIEIYSKGHMDYVSYDNRPMWEQVLKLLDKHL